MNLSFLSPSHMATTTEPKHLVHQIFEKRDAINDADGERTQATAAVNDVLRLASILRSVGSWLERFREECEVVLSGQMNPDEVSHKTYLQNWKMAVDLTNKSLLEGEALLQSNPQALEQFRPLVEATRKSMNILVAMERPEEDDRI